MIDSPEWQSPPAILPANAGPLPLREPKSPEATAILEDRCITFSGMFGAADYGRPWPYERVARRRRDGMEREARKAAASNIPLWKQFKKTKGD